MHQQLTQTVTDQKRAQEELAQSLAFRERVMGILGHDLRNPLGAVRALASLLLRRRWRHPSPGRRGRALKTCRKM
jgi:signal transduction histidine kinase